MRRAWSLCCLFLMGCGDGASFTVLTYNVAGLPNGLSKSMPEIYTTQISPKLNFYDLVLVQEDFGFHQDLVSEVEHPHRSIPKRAERAVNDGLNRFSIFPFDDHERSRWDACFGGVDNGSDCLADKGFSFARTDLGDGDVVDIYNLHMDAGRSNADILARRGQVRQLVDFILARSADRPIIVAGDTNLKLEQTPEDGELFDQLLNEAGLTDACRSLSCGDERIDRVLFRSSADFAIVATSWEVDARFVDEAGADLSDHKAVGVELAWERR